jgi:hypothetical protein
MKNNTFLSINYTIILYIPLFVSNLYKTFVDYFFLFIYSKNNNQLFIFD